MAGLLGMRPSRHFKIYREEWPGIFRFNGKLYQEHYNPDTMEDSWVEIDEAEAERWLSAKRWVDIEDPIEQFAAALGIEFQPWQKDWLKHYGTGEKLVPKGLNGSEWVPRTSPFENIDHFQINDGGEIRRLDPRCVMIVLKSGEEAVYDSPSEQQPGPG